MLRIPKRLAGKRPSGPMLMSTAALVVALGGTSYAAATIGTKDIRNNAVVSPKIDDGTIRSIDIRDGGIFRRDLAPGLARRGPQGPAGADGRDGADGQDGSDATGRWALVGRDGTILDQSGGFEIVAGYPELPNTAPEGQPNNALRANGNVYIDANEDLSDNGIVATVVLQNTINQDANAGNAGRNPGADANPEFSGEITVSRCNFTGNTGVPIPTNCAPAGAQNETSFVVSPRLSDGSVTAGDAATGSRKAFYVVITGDSTDLVEPTPAP